MFENVVGKISHLLKIRAAPQMSDRDFLEQEIRRWKYSPERRLQIQGYQYFRGEHDILRRKRTVIGEKGELAEVENLPNNRIVDNQYGKLVLQKANYMLGQPFVVESENKLYVEALQEIFNKRFLRLLKNAGKAALNGGIAWIYVFLDEQGEIGFRLFPAYEILPFWKDSEHTELDCAIRLYAVQGYEGTTPKLIEKVEVYDLDGVHRYILENGILKSDFSENEAADFPYVTVNGQGLNWKKIPLVAIKYNESEIPLLKRVKTLQDGLNIMLSDFENNMQEDLRNTILVLKNYDGTDLGEFRKNLMAYGAVKVRCDGEAQGGVETLEINVNAENFKTILEIFKKALIENGMGFDAKNDRLSGNPNQMNIQSMYSDIDLDANDMETELQAAFEEILWFVNVYLSNMGKGDFEGEKVSIVFNRDMLMNESEIIADCVASASLLSTETVIGQHPWIGDVQRELERLNKQKEEEQAEFEKQQGYNPFVNNGKNGDVDEKQ